MVLFKKINEELIVPINSSIETKIQVNGRTIKMVYKEFSAVSDNVLAQSSTGINFLNSNILRKKSNGTWGVVYSNLDNEVYISSDNKVRFNIKALTGYTADVKILVEYT